MPSRKERGASSRNDQLDLFINRIKSLGPIYPRAEVRFLAYRPDDEWHCSLGSMTLGSGPPPGFPKSAVYEFGRFKVGRVTIQLRSLDGMATRLRRGLVPLPSMRILLSSPRLEAVPREQRSSYSVSWSKFDIPPDSAGGVRYDAQSPRRFELGGQWMMWQTPEDGERWASLPDFIASCPEPYRNRDEFTRLFLNFQQDTQYFGQGRFVVSAPIPGSFDLPLEPTASDLVVRLSVPKGSVPRDFRLGALLVADGRAYRRSMQLRAKGRSARPPLQMERKLRTEDCLSAHLWLTYRGLLVGATSVVLPKAVEMNPRLAAFQFFDPEFAKISDFIHDTAQENFANRFEIAIGWLLGLAGFVTVYTGARPTQLSADEIDYLAFVPKSREVMTVEVTIAAPSEKDKMGKLRTRTDGIIGKLPGHDVLPVLFTAKTDLHAAEVKMADDFGIVLVNMPMIDELLNKILSDSGPKAVFDDWARLLPRRDTRVGQ